MSLRIPLTADQTLQTEFHEIERRLRKLERSLGTAGDRTTIQVVGGGPGVSLKAIYDRLTAIEQALAALQANGVPVESIEDYVAVGPDASKGAVPDPGIALPPTGVAQHVLTEDNYWGFPFRGLLGVVSPGDSTDPTDSLNLLGDLGVNGNVSARDINCRALTTIDGVTLEGDDYQLESLQRGLVKVVTDGTQTDPPYDVVDINAGLHTQHLSASDINCYSLYTHGSVEYNDTFFDDLRVEPVARTTGANAPSFEKYFDDALGSSRGVYLYSFDDATAGSEKEIFFTMQMPHSWAEGTPIRLHVHWVGAVSDTAADPRWGLEYCFKDAGETFGDTVIVYSPGTHFPGDIEGTPDPDVTAGTHYITPLVTITPDTTNDKISAVLIGRVFRDSANGADTYNAVGAKVGLLYIDAHVELSSPGSRLQYIK